MRLLLDTHAEPRKGTVLRFERTAVIALLAIATWTPLATSGEYCDPSGCSFTYPDGWVAVANPSQHIDWDTCPAEIHTWLTKNRTSLNKVNMILIRTGQDETPERLNVAVSAGEFVVNDSNLKNAVESLIEQSRSMGTKIENVLGRLQKLGTNEVIIVEYEHSLPVVPFQLKQRTVFFVGGGNTYMVTYAATADAFAAHSETFDRILASFKVPPSTPVAQRVETSSNLKFDFEPAFACGIGILVVYAAWRGCKRLIVRSGTRPQ